MRAPLRSRFGLQLDVVVDFRSKSLGDECRSKIWIAENGYVGLIVYGPRVSIIQKLKHARDAIEIKHV